MESEEKFRTFFDKSMDGILLTTSDGSIFAANPAACQMFGRTEEEICSLGRGEIIAKEDTHMQDLLEQRTKKGYYRGNYYMFTETEQGSLRCFFRLL